MLVTLNDVLPKAQKEGYGVGLFNTTDTDMLEAVISAAEELRSPVIIGTAEVLLPNGELQLIAPSILHAARRASVPVVVHYDHGLTFDRCIEALKLGFSSIMFDGSAGDPTENVAATREVARIAHSFGASIEAEIGHVGNADTTSAADRYTTVDEAVSFTEATGVDALAIAIGTAHGAYKTKPKLDLARLRDIRNALQIPLVLHGGSNNPDKEIGESVTLGINKINISSDIKVAFFEKMREVLQDKGLREPNEICPPCIEAMKVVAKHKLDLFQTTGKASLYR